MKQTEEKKDDLKSKLNEKKELYNKQKKYRRRESNLDHLHVSSSPSPLHHAASLYLDRET